MQATDPELVQQIRRGDQGAFRELVRRHADGLFAMAYSLLGSAPDAEDAVQETLMTALKRFASFEGRSTVGTWMRGILVFKADKIRRSRRLRTALPLQDFDQGGAAGSADKGLVRDSAVAAVDSRADAKVMLDSLSHEHREILVLRELEQLSYDEISKMLKIPVGTVESRLFRARQELKKRFKIERD